jgi:shikimate dehydrogenase
MARRLGVVGDPVEHSRSPQLHLAAFDVLGLDWSYERIQVPRGELANFVNGLDSTWRGLSVTMPLKGEAFTLASWSDEASRLTGGANTLVAEDFSSDAPARSWRAFNTDVAGIEQPLRLLGVRTVSSATIVGGGATAASALVALSQLACPVVHVVVRNPSRAAELEDLANHLGVAVSIHQLENLETVPRSDVVISSIPGSAGVELTQLAREPGDVLFDIAYDVWPSTNASNWVERGGQVLSGLTMLAAQALVQVRIFVNGDPVAQLDLEPKIRAAMHAAVGLDESGLIVRSVG